MLRYAIARVVWTIPVVFVAVTSPSSSSARSAVTPSATARSWG